MRTLLMRTLLLIAVAALSLDSAFVALGFSSTHASEFETVTGSAGPDRGVFVSPTQDGGYVTVGVTQNEGNEDVYLVKTDAEGQPLWSKSYGGAEEDNGWCVRELANGFVIAGFTKSFGAGGYDFYLIRTDDEGELEWFKTYGGEGDDRCWALEITSDGGFALLGETSSFGAGERDCYLVEVDAMGNELWSQTYGGEKGDRCFSISTATDGGYMIAGQSYSEGAGDRDAYVLKTKANGELEWSRTFGGKASDVAHCIAASGEDEYLVTGYTTSFGIQQDDPYLIMINAQGETQWTRVLELEGNNHTLTGERAVDGGYFLVGFSEYWDKGTAALLVKTNTGGEFEWSRDILLTSTGRSLGYTVRATSDGGCVFAGHTTVGSAGGLDVLLVKIAGQD